jgi:TolB-like protein
MSFMLTVRISRAPTLVLVLMLCTSCAGTRINSGPAADDATIRRLQARLAANQGDAEAWRDLGIIYLRASDFAQATDYLQQAYTRGADDPKTLLHLGLASETMGRLQTALRLYGMHADVPRTSPYRKLMKGRYQSISRRIAQEDVRQRLAQEAEIGGETSPRILAVVSFHYQGSDDQYEPLGRGLAEMLTIDLAKVPGLQLVERVRLQTLLDELELGQREAVDPSTAPRMGRLLGAGRMIGGNYNVVSGNSLSVDAAVVSVESGVEPAVESRSGSLSDLFRLQKEVAFALIEELGYTLTPEQRERIESVPTQNLQAFLAFSRGLQEDDAGNFEAAGRHFGQAHQLDPGFDAAAEHQETAEGMHEAAGSAEDVVARAASEDVIEEGPFDLVQHRARTLGASLGASLFPGQDARKPYTEAAGSGATRLPDPPPPPRGE